MIGNLRLIASLVARIGRRKTFRVAMVYAVLASLVLLSLYAAPFPVELAEWSQRVPLYLGFGFPVVVMLAWIFDRPKIVATGAGAAADELKRLRRSRKIHYAIIAGLLVGVVVMGLRGGRIDELLPFDEGDAESIAVLAFANASSDPVVEYVGDGMAEELKHLLEQVPGLEVVSGRYSFQYKGAARSPVQIGKELGVDAVLGGSFEISGDTLRVAAVLTSVSQGAEPLWTLTLERTLDELGQIQAEVAAGVVDAIAGRFIGAAPTLPMAEAVDADAYRDYLKARHVQRLGARRSGRFIRELYERAIERDPGFSRAYSDYADFLFWRGLPMGLSERESNALASDLLRRANRIDPARTRPTRWLDPALLAHIEGDWEGEEYALRQHIGTPSAYRTPDHSVYERYGAALMRGGLFFEALKYYELAEAADPGNAAVARDKGVGYLTLGKFDKALAEFDRGLELEPSMFDLHQLRAIALLGLGKVDEASEEWDYFYASHRVRLHFARGERSLALAVLEQAIAGLDPDSNLAGKRYEEIGFGFALLGDVDQAFEWWARAMEIGLPRMQGIRYRRVPTRVADDPRYTELLEVLGLTDAWREQLCERVALLEPVTSIEASCHAILSAEEAMASEHSRGDDDDHERRDDQ
ncbi:MAG: hypothetical protein V3U43_10835 [Pseudomonadales bacterium]